ncbi:MAG: HAD family hydrolase [Candidatus Marinimicrobia bacterium]|nr:HAD family hydrolase [Candidatus Neomarinimicrobiota bacterium]
MFNPKTDILALDFDGVVLDSIEECLTVSHNVLALYRNCPDRISSPGEIDGQIASEFRRLRNFIRHGQDFVFIHLALQQGNRIQNQRDFDSFLAENERLNSVFRKLFYEERFRFIREDLKGWLELNPFYPGMRKFLEDYCNKERLFIITTKLKENVLAIFDARSIEFIDKNIYSVDRKTGKIRIIEMLLEKYRIKPENFHFIEDQVDTLIQAKSTGVNLYLAAWGYNDDVQSKRAMDARIPVLTPEDFFSQFGN